MTSPISPNGPIAPQQSKPPAETDLIDNPKFVDAFIENTFLVQISINNINLKIASMAFGDE